MQTEFVSKTIAVIGAGLMGRGMARTLIRAGHKVKVYNRTRSKAEEAAAAGGKVADTPADAANGAEVIITMLADPEALMTVVSGESGLIQTCGPGAVLIDSSTVSPPASFKVLELLRSKGADMLDAPVFGSKNEAESGQLGFIVGGEPETLRKVQSVLDCMGRTIYVGRNGLGSYAKLVVNLIIAATLQSFNEAMVLATKAGVDPDRMLEIIQSSRARSGIIEMKAPQILKRDFSPFFPLALMAKDMRLVNETASALDLELPFAGALQAILAQCVANGLGGEDFAASIKSIEAGAGVQVQSATTGVT